MKQIKASEVKPGMVVRWVSRGFTHEGTVERITSSLSEYTTRFINSPFGMDVLSETTVTVLSEPAQPEEPTEFGARVVVNGRHLVRAGAGSRPWVDEEQWDWWTWEEVCSFGPVTVIPDPGWTVPDAPEVPDWIEVWPDDDTALRKHKWRDVEGDVWVCVNDEWRWGDLLCVAKKPLCGPWTRVDDSQEPQEPVVPEQIKEWPEWDERLRAYPWSDADGCTWTYNDDRLRWGYRRRYSGRWLGVSGNPTRGPWTRGPRVF